jgi:hypothetical protein
MTADTAKEFLPSEAQRLPVIQQQWELEGCGFSALRFYIMSSLMNTLSTVHLDYF